MPRHVGSSAEFLRGLVSDAHLNFLVGAGASMPAITVLGPTEQLSEDVLKIPTDDSSRSIAQASLDKGFFDDVIAKSLGLDELPNVTEVIESYENFLRAIHRLLLERKSPLVPKQVNIFTTNNDILFETAFDRTGIEMNDGFRGRFSARFDLNNFRTRLFRLTLHYDNSSEVPVFNLLKVHGSVTWTYAADGKSIVLDHELKGVQETALASDAVTELVAITADTSAEILVVEAGKRAAGATTAEFTARFAELPIVNPTKDKFEKTVLQQTYYDLLRVFSNELEREGTVLFVIGFSFADEHLRSLVLRAANSNPTLLVYVFAYSNEAKTEIEIRFREAALVFHNLVVLGPSDFEEGVTRLDLSTVTRVLVNPITAGAKSGSSQNPDGSDDAR